MSSKGDDANPWPPASKIQNLKSELKMPLTVRVPQPLRNLTGGASTVQTTGDTLATALYELESAHPGMKERLLDDAGELRRFVNIYVNGEDVRVMDGLATVLKDGDELSIVPAVAGG
jgi:molybdopterin synthase sulfur carrier subunit